jgi:hypothetical protein
LTLKLAEMPSIPRPETELAELNREIERFEAEQALLADQRKKRAQAASRANWRVRYLRLARLVRRPSAMWEQWRIALLVIGPGLGGALIFVLVNLVSRSPSLALVAFFLGGAATLASVAALLFRPSEVLLPSATAEAEAQAQIATAHWKEALERLAEIQQQLSLLHENRRANMASGRVQRAALLQRPWKMMPSEEWTDFVVEVCRTLGGTVERRARAGDCEELVVSLDDRKVAAVAISSRDAINTEIVHQAVEFQSRAGCASCAIITNGRITGAAQDFASRNGCRIIGREEFPDFVVGTAAI